VERPGDDMTRQQWERVKDIFTEALEVEPSLRDTFAREAAAGDEELFSEVRRMLSESDRDSGLLSQPVLARPRTFATARVPQFVESVILARRFRIVRFIARGGMGEVYEAEDLDLGMRVALKTIRQGSSPNADLPALFKKEIQLARRVTHANVCRIYDLAQHEDANDGRPVMLLSMELLEGHTLGEHLRKHGPFMWRDALPLIKQIGAGIQAAHDAGIIHGDLKPGNIMLALRPGEDEPHAVVMDFGMALPVMRDSPGKSVSRGGTPEYSAPEQANGASSVTTATDVYSFGLVIAEMLGVPRRLPLKTEAGSLPSGWTRVLERCLQHDSTRRYSRPAEIAEALRSSLEKRSLIALRRAAVSLLLTAAVVALLWLLPFRRNATPVPSTVPLTTYPGIELNPTFSPDGTRVAFAWNNDNPDSFDIYEKQLGSDAKPLRLTTTPARYVAPSWSPDGLRIAFLRSEHEYYSGVFVIPASGGVERKLAEVHGTSTPAINWTPDGKWLVTPHRTTPGEAESLYLISANSGEMRRLNIPPPLLRANMAGAFSPDGRTLAVAHYPASAVEGVYLLPVARDWQPAGAITTVDTEMSCCLTQLMWSRDGSDLFYSKLRYGAVSLWRTSTRAGTAPVSVSGVGQFGWGGVALTAAGDKIAYSDYRWGSRIWRFDLASGASTPTPFLSSAEYERSPCISPDDKRVAFTSSRLGAGAIWVADRDGSNERQLTSLGGGGAPIWSPDGTQIAFDAPVSGNSDIYVVPAAGGKPRRMTNNPAFDVLPTWSRDGRWLYFSSSRSGGIQIWKMPSGGDGPPVQVTRNGGWRGLESIDGRFLYFAKAPGARSIGETVSIWRIPVEGGDEGFILPSVNNVRNFVVVKDGIYFERDTSLRGFEICFYRFSTGKSEQIAKIGKKGFEGLSLSSDRRWLLFSSFEERSGDLWLVDNFR